VMNRLLQDLRHALRQLRKNAGFTAVAVITLALGIGANTTIFRAVDAVLLKPLPYKDANRLVVMWEQNPHRGWFENIASVANYLDWRQQNHVFSDLAAFDDISFNLAGSGTPEEIPAERVTSSLFPLFGVQPLLGRVFLPEEDRPGSSPEAVLSYGLWQQHYGGDPALVGKQISLNGESYTVVGIMPASFSDDYAAPYTANVRVWASGLDLQPAERTRHAYHVLARLKPGVTLAQAQAEMDTIAKGIEQQFPESKGWGVALVSLNDQVVEYARPALLVLFGAVGLVLLIACANVANLQLVRATGRQKEVAIRTALGATRAGIARQFLIESTLLSLLGAGLGLPLAGWGSEILMKLSPPGAPDIGGGGINSVVLFFCFLVALGTGIAFGLVPALTASKPNVNDTLKESGRGPTRSARSRRLRDALVVSEFALALALLVGAGLMIKTLAHLRHVDIGFSADNLLTLRVPLEGPQYRDQQRQAEFLQELLARIESLPGVEAGSVSRGVPMNDWAGWGFVTADQPHPPAGEIPDANYVVIAPHYFRTMGIPLREGRVFTDADTTSSEPVVIVSEELAHEYWPGQDPIGKRLKTDTENPKAPWLSVVGVAGNVRSRGQYDGPMAELYVPFTQYPWQIEPRNIMIRTKSDPTTVFDAVRREVSALDKDLPLADLSTMKDVVAGPILQGQTVMLLLGAFAALALVLASVGIYSVISYAVTQRTQEIGIRMALGANGRDVMTLVVRHGLILAAAGVALGCAGGLGITRFLSSQLFEVNPTDPVTFGAVSALLAAVALLACYIPARRATKVDPMVALRNE
jgi:putative ABC transport system permease protein